MYLVSFGVLYHTFAPPHPLQNKKKHFGNRECGHHYLVSECIYPLCSPILEIKHSTTRDRLPAGER